MTSELATIGLVWDGNDVQDWPGGILIEIVKGVNETPSVRGADVIVPSREGRIEGNRKNDVLTIELSARIRADVTTTNNADAQASFRENMAQVREWFAPSRGRAVLIATLEDGTVQQISARPLPSMIWNEPVKSQLAIGSIELEAYGDWEVTGS